MIKWGLYEGAKKGMVRQPEPVLVGVNGERERRTSTGYYHSIAHPDTSYVFYNTHECCHPVLHYEHYRATGVLGYYEVGVALDD